MGAVKYDDREQGPRVHLTIMEIMHLCMCANSSQREAMGHQIFCVESWGPGDQCYLSFFQNCPPPLGLLGLLFFFNF